MTTSIPSVCVDLTLIEVGSLSARLTYEIDKTRKFIAENPVYFSAKQDVVDHLNRSVDRWEAIVLKVQAAVLRQYPGLDQRVFE